MRVFEFYAFYCSRCIVKTLTPGPSPASGRGEKSGGRGWKFLAVEIRRFLTNILRIQIPFHFRQTTITENIGNIFFSDNAITGFVGINIIQSVRIKHVRQDRLTQDTFHFRLCHPDMNTAHHLRRDHIPLFDIHAMDVKIRAAG